MKNAIIVHGKPSQREYAIARSLGIKASKFHWLGWLGKQLRKNGYEVWAPEMPKPYAPDWDTWVKEVEKAKIGPQTLLVGHSCGGGFWVKYLSLHKDLKVGKVILVAPWLDPDGDETQGFFNDFKIDPDLAERTQGFIIFNSDNDMGNVLKSVAKIRQTVKGVQYREFHKYGHFTLPQMRTRKFPQLLQECLS
jgi:uncharacterized protein